MVTRAKLFSQIASAVDAAGKLSSDALASAAGLDSANVTGLIDSAYINSKIGSVGITAYSSSAQFPISASTGDQAWAIDTEKLYIYNGSQWKEIYVGPNSGPEWTIEPLAEYSVGLQDSVSVTGQASDPDGFPISYDYDLNPSNPSSLSSVVNDSDGVFHLITSSTGGEFTFRFRAHDGLNTLSKVISVTVAAYDYDTLYTAITGGSITTVTYTSGTVSLDAIIDARSTGDCIALEPGTYSITGINGTVSSGASTPFRNKKIAIIGKGSTPGAVVVTINHSSARDKPVFDADTDGKCQLANMKLIRSATSTTNYIAALTRGNEGAFGGYARHIIFDANGGDISWLYDNTLYTTKHTFWDNCSFINYGQWRYNYSGTQSTVEVTDCAFENLNYDPAGNHVGATFSGTQSTNVTFGSSPTYDYTEKTSSGHLYDWPVSSGQISTADI